jgi:hypothetical protein
VTLPILRGSANFGGNFDSPETMSSSFALDFTFLGAIYKGIVVLIFFVTLRLRAIAITLIKTN